MTAAYEAIAAFSADGKAIPLLNWQREAVELFVSACKAGFSAEMGALIERLTGDLGDRPLRGRERKHIEQLRGAVKKWTPKPK